MTDIATINYVTGGAAARAAFGQPEPPLVLENLFLCLVTLTDGNVVVGRGFRRGPEPLDVTTGRKMAYNDALRQIAERVGA